jgi:SAM-dependent methyltransferase
MTYMCAEFNQYAANYERHMQRSCSLSGETPGFYALGRMGWLRQRRLRHLLPLDAALDYGCGTGGSLPHFGDFLGCSYIIGIDPSRESLAVAQQRWGAHYPIRLYTPDEYKPAADLPFAFANGVFHHISEDRDRFEALDYIRCCLKPGGLFALWENNPWNPIVVYGMRLNEFDRNARTLSCRTVIRLLRDSGFAIEAVDFCFFFPNFARALRCFEPALRWCPMGAQYLVLARKK